MGRSVKAQQIWRVGAGFIKKCFTAQLCMLLLPTQCPGVGVDHEGGNRAEQGGDDEGAHGVRDMGARVVGQAHAHGRHRDA